jgi:hypothetical protein
MKVPRKSRCASGTCLREYPFPAVFTHGRGIAGRQISGQPPPDHGKQEYDLNFHDGHFATPHHPQYHENTALKNTRAPDHGDLDTLADVLPTTDKIA